MIDTSKKIVEINQAGVIRQNKWIIKNISLEVNRGEILTLIGPNGSGKTTTAKLAAGIIKPDEGKVHSQKNIVLSYVPQNMKVDWTIPINVKHFMKLTNSIDNKNILKALNLVDIGHLIDEQIQTLSGGEFQRALIARAIARKPDLLILDEPLQGLDFTGEKLLYNLINKIKDEIKCGIILISHNLHMVMATTDQVICLNGHICCSGTPNIVLQSKEYTELFGPNKLDGLALYTHSHNHTHETDGTLIDNPKVKNEQKNIFTD